MPRRPRAHQLEDCSRHAFAEALPSQWVVERVEHDYGLDVRVEVFTEDGHATGQMFFAQLKATDRLRTRNGISVRVKPAHLSYWNRAVPTMVVVWVAPTDTLYWRWTRRHHPWPRTHTPRVESFRCALHVLDAPVEVDGHMLAAIAPAPEGYRLFGDVAPLEDWCPPPAKWNEQTADAGEP